MIHGITNDFLYSACKIELECTNGENKCFYTGTGFFVVKDLKAYLITNRHMVDLNYRNPNINGYKIEHFYIDNRHLNPQTGLPDIVEKKEIVNFNSFMFHPNAENDIACLSNVKIKNSDWNISFYIPFELLADQEKLDTKLSVCDFIAYPGYPTWHDTANNNPIFKSGTIASDPRFNYSCLGSSSLGDCIAYEGFSTGGASGSPVFALQKGFRLGTGLTYDGSDDFYRPVMLVGINAGHFPTPNGHSSISYLYKSSAIRDLIDICSQS